MANHLIHRQNRSILASYWPYKVHVYVPTLGTSGELVQLDSRVEPAIIALQPATGFPFSTRTDQVQPVLYDLADLPSLPAADGEGVTPLVLLLRKLNFASSLDKGTGEGVIAADIIGGSADVNLAGRTTLLHLLVHTGYIDPDTYEEGAGSDYEVFISAYGDASWRNITADKLSVDQAGLTGRGTWHKVNGTWLLNAFEFLRELHMAVGAVAEPDGYYDADLHRHAYRYHYVRKELPAGTVPYQKLSYMKGGQRNG